jgi:hypothetical protein
VADYRIALRDVLEMLVRRREAGLCYKKALELSPANEEAKKKVIAYYDNR